MSTDATLRPSPSLRYVSQVGDMRYYFLPHLPSAGKVHAGLAAALAADPLPTSVAEWKQHLADLTEDPDALVAALQQSALLVSERDHSRLTDAFKEIPRQDHVTLMLTSNCNLRCRYCYAEAGERPKLMSRPMIDAALDYFWRSRFGGGRRAALVFHGGGEPTLAVRELKYAMSAFAEEAKGRGIEPLFSLTTNGAFGDAARRVLARYRCALTLSWDGPPEIQERQRPAANARTYAHRLTDNLAWAKREGLPVSIRTTVTADSLAKLDHIIEFFADLGLTALSLEPCAVDGRADASMAPKRTSFALACAEQALAWWPRGVRIKSTFLAWGKFSPRFCGMTTGNCLVTPEGNLSACYEVLDPGNEQEARYLFGHIGAKGEQPVIDADKRTRISSRDVQAIDACAQCPFEYSCAGWCPYKISRAGFRYQDGIDPDACGAIKAGTTRFVEGIADSGWHDASVVELAR